jgi:hypothetical protein
MVGDINKGQINHLDYGLIIQNFRTLLRYYNNFRVVYARHQVNSSIHAIARATLNLSHASRNTFNVIPNCIVTIV